MKGRHKYFRYCEDRYTNPPYHDYVRHCGDSNQISEAIELMTRYGYLPNDTHLSPCASSGMMVKTGKDPYDDNSYELFNGDITLSIIQTNANKRDKKALVRIYGSNWRAGICLASYVLTPLKKVYLKDKEFGTIQMFPDPDDCGLIVRIDGITSHYDYRIEDFKIESPYNIMKG